MVKYRDKSMSKEKWFAYSQCKGTVRNEVVVTDQMESTVKN